MPIHFGTDGWRAVISDSFTFSNLRMVSQAIADAVASDHWDRTESVDAKKIIIGYDTRFLSDRFAGEVARVLAANGFTTLLAQSDSPTPAISYAVKNNNAIAGVMITASHNAPRYNGVKLKGAFGGSALPEQCRRVEIYINDNEEQARGPNLMDFKKAREAGLIQRFNPLPAYFDHLRKLINTDVTPNEAVNLIFGYGELGQAGVSVRVAKRLKTIVGADSPDWGQYREAAFMRLIGGPQGQGGPQVIVSRIDRALDGRGMSLTKEIFSEDEIKRLRALRHAINRTITPKGAANPSKTGYEVSRMLEDAFGKVSGIAGLLKGDAVGTAAALAGGVPGEVRLGGPPDPGQARSDEREG